MPPECLRPDLPSPSSFTVTELPYEAKLDQNEAPSDLPRPLKRRLAELLVDAPWNRYPQPDEYRAAKAHCAEVLGIAPERLALTVGADQVIQGAFLLAGGPGRRARWFEPTYPYVSLASRVTGTMGEGIVLGPDVDQQIDAAKITTAPGPHLVVLVSPNNPTGGAVAREALDAALADPARLVLVDEAYADFAGESVLGEAGPPRPNLLVARSLSKSLLAAVRLGFAIGHPEVIAAFERTYTAPYHLNTFQLRVAAAYGEILPFVREAAGAVVEERGRVLAALRALPGVSTQDSRGNFLLFAVDGGAERALALHGELARAGIRIRNVSGLPGLGAHLRVTIGHPPENDRFLTALGALLRTRLG
jgi:histidinol-phosphate aminotransferase